MKRSHVLWSALSAEKPRSSHASNFTRLSPFATAHTSPCPRANRTKFPTLSCITARGYDISLATALLDASLTQIEGAAHSRDLASPYLPSLR